MVKEVAKWLLPLKLVSCLASIKRCILESTDPDHYSTKSYSQEGEDMILRRIFETQNIGFYVDVGAHHPFRFSNTYCLYEKGWSGINIDAMPGSMNVFRRLRPRDINIECGVALSDSRDTFFVFKEGALNTFDKRLAQQRISTGHEIESRQQLRARPLAELLKEYLPPGQGIDLLTVDVEGRDLDVLKSNDWEIFRPRVLITEELRSVSDGRNNTVRDFLAHVGYQEFARTYNSVFYVLS